MRRLYRAWMRFARGLNVVMTIALFSALFVLIAPFALIRLGDPLRRRLRRADTYWEPHRPHEATIERLLRPF